MLNDREKPEYAFINCLYLQGFFFSFLDNSKILTTCKREVFQNLSKFPPNFWQMKKKKKTNP